MNRLSSIQHLRAIAALMVVWHHAISQIPALQPLLPTSTSGAHGVDLFFVISGFIMVLTTEGKSIGAGEFLRRRVIRVVPLYWLFTGVVIVTALLRPQWMRSTVVTPEHAVLSLLFVPHVSPAHPQTAWPILVPGWTLNMEMAFYALFALALAIRREATVALVVAGLSLLVLLGAWAGPFASPIASAYTSPMLLQFGVGVLLGWVLVRWGAPLPLPWAVPAIIIGFAMLLSVATDDWRSLQTLGAGLIVAGALAPGLVSRSVGWLDELGDASYSIYLSHIPVLGLARVVWQHTVGTGVSPAHAAGFMAFALVTSAVAGVLIYRFLEMPLLRFLMRATARPSTH